MGELLFVNYFNKVYEFILTNKIKNMKAVLEIETNDLNIHLIEVINSLFNQDFTEITIKKSELRIEEFDKSLNFSEMLTSFKENGHNDYFLKI